MKPAVYLPPLDPPPARFQLVEMDLLGLFPTSPSESKWIIVATNYLTRYAEIKAVPTETAVEITRSFAHDIVLRHGVAAVLITDCRARIYCRVPEASGQVDA